MTAPKATTIGKQAKTELPESVFAEELHESLVHETARAELASRRRGTASTLGRGEVSMTGAKAWRQKGTGRARAGALSTPQRRGGGVAFGPKPRSYQVKVNRKARRRALRSALSVHAARDSVAVLADEAFAQPSTKQAQEALDKWGRALPALVVIDADETDVLKSFRNIPRIAVMPAPAVGVADVLSAASMIVSERALEVLEARAGAEVSRGAGGAEVTAEEASS